MMKEMVRHNERHARYNQSFELENRQYVIRPLYRDETDLLKEFLYEAIFVPEGMEAPSRAIVEIPELKLYIDKFGTQRDDHCLAVDCRGTFVGAVWVRIMNDYGHVDDQTPSLAISLRREYRHQGIGYQLMTEMIGLLRNKGYGNVSLSVQKANPALRLYLKLGFKVVNETGEEFIMIKELNMND